MQTIFILCTYEHSGLVVVECWTCDLMVTCNIAPEALWCVLKEYSISSVKYLPNPEDRNNVQIGLKEC